MLADSRDSGSYMRAHTRAHTHTRTHARALFLLSHPALTADMTEAVAYGKPSNAASQQPPERMGTMQLPELPCLSQGKTQQGEELSTS